MSAKNDSCQVKLINEKKVKSVKEQMMDQSVFADLSETFKTLGDSTRVKILYALSRSELCVCDIAAVLNMTNSAVSHQLRVLRNMKLVKFRKDGKVVYYSLSDKHIMQLIRMGHEHVIE